MLLVQDESLSKIRKVKNISRIYRKPHCLQIFIEEKSANRYYQYLDLFHRFDK